MSSYSNIINYIIVINIIIIKNLIKLFIIKLLLIRLAIGGLQESRTPYNVQSEPPQIAPLHNTCTLLYNYIECNNNRKNALLIQIGVKILRDNE